MSASDGLREVVKDWLREQAWTQQDLAKALNRSQGGVSMLLSGERHGGALSLVEDFARLCGLSVSELVRQAEARDLSRHGHTKESVLHPGGADAAIETRLQQQIETLKGQLAFYRNIVRRTHRLTAAAYKLLGGEGGPSVSIESRSGKPR